LLLYFIFTRKLII